MANWHFYFRKNWKRTSLMCVCVQVYIYIIYLYRCALYKGGWVVVRFAPLCVKCVNFLWVGTWMYMKLAYRLHIHPLTVLQIFGTDSSFTIILWIHWPFHQRDNSFFMTSCHFHGVPIDQPNDCEPACIIVVVFPL